MVKKSVATIGIGALAICMSPIKVSAMENGTINTPILNIRSGPSTNYNKIDKVYKGEIVEILENSNGWKKVKLPNGKIGWASGQYITKNSQFNQESSITSIIGKKGKVIASTSLNIRSGGGTNYSILGKANYGQVVELLEKSSNGWYKVKLSSGLVGWASGQYIIEIAKEPEDENVIQNTNVPYDKNQVVNLAHSLLGTPYVWGGNGPNSFDCSGFTKYVYSKSVGKDIPRVSRLQAKAGVEIERKNFAAGDLVYFDTDLDGVINHVGIYIGKNEFIHCSGTTTNPEYVKKDNLETNYWKKVLVGARRF